MTVIKPEMISDKITIKDMLPLSFLKKSVYTGSKGKLNYKLAKTEVPVGEVPADAPEGTEPEKKTVLRVYSWPGPFAFDCTDPEKIESWDTEFSNAGIDAAIEYLNTKV